MRLREPPRAPARVEAIRGRAINSHPGEKSLFFGCDDELVGVETLALQHYARRGWVYKLGPPTRLSLCAPDSCVLGLVHVCVRARARMRVRALRVARDGAHWPPFPGGRA